MKSKINFEIRKLLLEIVLIVTFLIATIPLWEYISNPTLAKVANHYSNIKDSEVVVTNSKKYIYSETYEEAIRERNIAFITSYKDTKESYNLYLLLKVGTNYDNIFFSNGTKISQLKDLYYDTNDEYIYFKIDEKEINSKETIKYYYYIWNKDLKKDKNIKIKFTII